MTRSLRVPTAIRGFPAGATAAYVRVGRTSFDWALSAGWIDPTSLDFQTEVIAKRKQIVRISFPCERPVPPDELVDAIEDVVSMARGQLEREGCVRAVEDAWGFEFVSDLPTHTVALQLITKAWPAIEGVTVPVKDSTL